MQIYFRRTVVIGCRRRFTDNAMGFLMHFSFETPRPPEGGVVMSIARGLPASGGL
jgi:hypothetical protein